MTRVLIASALASVLGGLYIQTGSGPILSLAVTAMVIATLATPERQGDHR